MGCNISTLDSLPAVALCRYRCEFLDDALADAHAAHMHSLKTHGPALHRFFVQLEDSGDSDSHLLLHHSESAPDDTDEELQFLFNPPRYDYVNHDTISSAPPNSGGYSPPPSSSPWDFFNLFEVETSFEIYQVPYSPSGETDIKEKEKENKKKKEGEDVDVDVDGGSHENGRRGGEVNPKGICEAMTQIQILFQRASDSGIPILEMMDVGKLRCHRNIAVNPVSFKMMNVFTPSIKSSLLGPRMGSGYQGVDKHKEGPKLRESLLYAEKTIYVGEEAI